MKSCNCICLTCSGIAENDEVVAAEDFTDVGNIPGKLSLDLLFTSMADLNIAFF